jgi:tRNA pseudouridine13 synthase
MALPYLTADLPGIGGQIKTAVEDFIVQEVPLYQPDGVGTHCYFLVEKRGISTMEAVRLLARALGRKNFDIGYAGLKDAQAVTTQWFSIEHEETARVRELAVPHLKIVNITRHRNKIKVGHLAGNRFVIKVRNAEWGRAGATLDEPRRRAEAILKVLADKGTPNFFGPQRFGMRKDNHQLGLSLLRGDAQQFANRFLGDPDESVDHGQVLLARQHYAKGRLDLALQNWPGHLAEERRALSALIQGKGNPKKVLFSVSVKLKQLLVSALQSHLFNEVLIRRLPQFSTVLPGDLCWKHDNGACFAVDNTAEAAATEQPRADAHEISPSGPMFGYKMTEPAGEPAALEAAVLKEMELTPGDFGGAEGSHGGRRSMRLFAKDILLDTGADSRGPFLQFAFTLPSGSYATVFLGEIMKEDVALD